MLSGQTAVTGVGYTRYSRDSGVSVLQLAAEACRNAIADAGLKVDDVDGLVCFHMNDSALARDVATVLGLRAVNWWSDVSAGGTYACAAVGEAALAIAAGLANHVLVYRALNGRSGARTGHSRARNVTGIDQFMAPHGFGSPPQIFGMLARRHMSLYGTTREQFGHVAITMREHARKSMRAMRREPITMDEYLRSRVIADPYRLLDCCLESDGACAVLVSKADRAADLQHHPVYVAGVVHGGGRGPRVPFDRCEDLSESCFRRLAPALYRQSGLGPADVDVAELYDAFTFEVIHQLEQLGFCNDGEGGPFVAEGRIALGGELPVNTHGGLLSEAYVQGLNHVVEAVIQLRGAAGERQVPDARVALVSAYAFSSGSLLMLRAD